MTRRPSWLDPTGTLAALVLAVLVAIANGIWILLDHSAPSWDQANYLFTTLSYQDALDHGGVVELLRSIKNTDPSHGPLFTVLLLPFVYVFGPEPGSAMALNLVIAPILFFGAGQIAWIVFRDWRVRLLTIVLVASMPLMVGLFHNVLQDFLLVTLTTLSLLLLLMSEGFKRRWVTIAMGVTMGLGMLTKVTFPLFVAGPVLVVVLRVVADWIALRNNPARPRSEAVAEAKQVAITLGATLVVFLLISLAWYGPNFSATIDYIRSTTGGPLAEGAGPEQPLTFRALASFTLGVVNFNLTWIIVLLGLFAAALSFGRLRSLFRQPLRWEPVTSLAFLLAWAVVPFLSVATAHNQDVRLMAPAFPAVAILVAGAICAVPQRSARLALTGVAIVLVGYQTLNHTVNITPSFLPDQLHVSVEGYTAAIPLGSEPIGYEKLPADDQTTPVQNFLEQVAASLPGGESMPRLVCLLQSEPVVNTNTFRYLTAARNDPFLVTDIVQEPGGTERQLEEALSACNFALFVEQPRSPGDAGSRRALVNEPFAAHRMTPRLLALFGGPRKTFPLEDSPVSDSVTVLVRTPGEGPVGANERQYRHWRQLGYLQPPGLTTS